MDVPAKVLIVDGKALCYYAFYVAKRAEFYGNRGTAILYQFFHELQNLCKRLRVVHMCFCWDSMQSHRKRLFPEYKSNRALSMDEDLQACKVQFEVIRRDILPRLGFENNFMATGYEADDLIAGICRYSMPKDDQTYIIASDDKDLFQLLTENVCIYQFRKKHTYTRSDFVKEYRIDPLFWPGVKAMAGCSSDGIPGIRGVGETTAIKYILESGNSFEKHPKIDTPEGQSVIRRNLPLVRLPFKKTPRFALNWKSRPSYTGWVSFCREYGLSSLLESGIWKNISSGKPPSGEVVMRIGKTRVQV